MEHPHLSVQLYTINTLSLCDTVGPAAECQNYPTPRFSVFMSLCVFVFYLSLQNFQSCPSLSVHAKDGTMVNPIVHLDWEKKSPVIKLYTNS